MSCSSFSFCTANMRGLTESGLFISIPFKKCVEQKLRNVHITALRIAHFRPIIVSHGFIAVSLKTVIGGEDESDIVDEFLILLLF